MPPDRRILRALALSYLCVQSLALMVYWSILLGVPSSRGPFLVPGAPDSTLLGFALPDLTIYLGSSLASAYALARGRRWLWPALLLHAGAAAYGALYALLVGALEPTRWLGAAMMTPALVAPPAMAWLFRPALAPRGR